MAPRATGATVSGEQPTEHRIEIKRRARYYVLGEDRAASAAWLVCHGYGQLAGTFISEFRVVADGGARVVAPEGRNRFYLPSTTRSHSDTPVGATWMTREDRAAEMADYVDYLDAVRSEAIAPDAPLTVLGFSQGVATATRWVALGRAPVTRLIVWAGAIPPELDVAAMSKRVAQPIVLVSGDRDEFAGRLKLDEQIARVAAAGVPHDVLRFSGGHRTDRAVLARLAGLPPDSDG